MKKSIFLSRPSYIPKNFNDQCRAFERHLRKRGVIPRRLGGTDYSIDAPLKAVIELMKECSGAIILGYPQSERYLKTRDKRIVSRDITHLPTPWNQIEASIAYMLKLPVLVVAHEGIEGGIFDHGVTGEYVLNINLRKEKWFKEREVQGILKRWLILINQI